MCGKLNDIRPMNTENTAVRSELRWCALERSGDVTPISVRALALYKYSDMLDSAMQLLLSSVYLLGKLLISCVMYHRNEGP